MNEDDLSRLRAEFPGWRFGASVGRGGERARPAVGVGERIADGALVTAWSVSALRARVEAEQAAPR
jgi:hypothetical protein